MFTISSFEFHKIKLPWFIARRQSTGLSGFRQCWSLITSGNRTKTVPEFKDALQSIWSALPEKAIDNAVKDYSNQLQACVSTSGGYFFYIQCDNSYNRC